LNVSRDLKQQIGFEFDWPGRAAAQYFPPCGSLSQALGKNRPPGPRTVQSTINATPALAGLFATAGVDIWHRGVHSFLVSISLTENSPLWAAVAGYYATHYSVRAIAHLLGCFQLYSLKQVVRLSAAGGAYSCTYSSKKANDREHTLYWREVTTDPVFANDPLFADTSSGVEHRDRANYADHLPRYPQIRNVDVERVQERVRKISQIELGTVPAPRASEYPDIEAVQMVAYHRILRFRELVDEALGAGNRFWNVHRDPPWAREYTDFQATEEPGLGRGHQ